MATNGSAGRRLAIIMVAIAVILPACRAAEHAPLAGADRGPVLGNAAIATDHPVATEAGLAMLERGGNAVDAAVAASFTLSVVRPYSCGIGGGGFMLIHIPAEDGRRAPHQIVLNYRETAPAAVGPNYYVDLDDPRDDASRYGIHAAGVPGTVAGLLHALEHHGTLDRETVLAPAIRAAEQGFRADADFVRAAHDAARTLNERPHLKSLAAGIWTEQARHGRVVEGDLIRNPRQARALRLIAEHGADAFYRGPIADAIVRTMQTHGGPITRDDLADYEVRIMQPLRTRFHDYEMLSMPPPSSGGIAMGQVLGILERRASELAGLQHNSPAYVHLLAEALKHAFADRAEHLADADFAPVPIEDLLDAAYLDDLAGRIDMNAALDDPFAYGSVTPASSSAPAGGGTSHLSVIDERGMAVACTETINLRFGSLVEVAEFGFALNNEMDDFTTIPGAPNAFGLRQSDRNVPEPGKRPLSSMSPTIVLDEAGEAILVAGASGGPRIITATLQSMLNVLLFDMPPARAVDAPRFHHQWMPEVLYLERRWPDRAATERALGERGHKIETMNEIGVVQLIHRGPDGLRGAADPRKGGTTAGH